MAIMRAVQLRRCSGKPERPLHISRFAAGARPPQEPDLGGAAVEDAALSIQRVADPRPGSPSLCLREGTVAG